MGFFTNFCSIFAFLLLVARANIDFVLVFTVQNGSRTFFFKLLFAWIWDQKNHPKTSQKPCPGDPKIDLENVLFFNIDFFAFWSDFGGSWASNLEPSWLKMPPPTVR